MKFERYWKLAASILGLVLYIIMQAAGLDAGEVGVGIDGDVLLNGLLTAVLVYASPKNEDSE